MTFDWMELWQKARREYDGFGRPDFLTRSSDQMHQTAADYLRDRVSEAFVIREEYDQRGVAFMDAAKKLNSEFDRAEAAEAEVARLQGVVDMTAFQVAQIAFLTADVARLRGELQLIANTGGEKARKVARQALGEQT